MTAEEMSEKDWLKKMYEILQSSLNNIDTDTQDINSTHNEQIERNILHLEEELKSNGAMKKMYGMLKQRGIEFSDDVWEYFIRQVVHRTLITPLKGFTGEEEVGQMIDNLVKEIIVDKKYPTLVVDGKTYIGYRELDLKEDKVFDSQEYSDENIKKMKEMTLKLKDRFDIEQNRGIYDMGCRDFTVSLCDGAGSGEVKQFKNKAPFFARRGDMIKDAHIYKFQDKFASLLVEHNKNDIGFRPMPQKNMWIDCSIPFDDGNIIVTGIHLHKIKVNDDGDMSYQVYDGDIEPVGFDDDGISVFYTGIAKDTTFYSYFSISKINTKIEERKKSAKYYCPFCNSPMIELAKDKVYCDLAQCSRLYQKGNFIVYDMKRKDLKRYQNAWQINDVWKVEQRIKLFICNLLDFMNNKEVKVEMLTSTENLVEQNKKRAKRGKPPIMPIHIIRVSGHLEKKLNLWRTQSRGSYELARNETTVDGHFRRFWDRDAWTRLYSWIARGKSNPEEIRMLLSKLVRKDADGHPLPEFMQYKWDDYYKVIYIWIEPFKKFEGEGETTEHIHVIEGVDDDV